MKMRTSGNYPMAAADESAAPYNEDLDKEVPVGIEVVLRKTVNVSMNYYDDKELKEAVRKQFILPQDAYKYIDKGTAKEHLRDWDVESLCVFEELRDYDEEY